MTSGGYCSAPNWVLMDVMNIQTIGSTANRVSTTRSRTPATRQPSGRRRRDGTASAVSRAEATAEALMPGSFRRHASGPAHSSCRGPFVAARQGPYIEVAERHHDDEQDDRVGRGKPEPDAAEGDLIDVRDPDLGRPRRPAAGHDVGDREAVEVCDEEEEHRHERHALQMREGHVPEPVPG